MGKALTTAGALLAILMSSACAPSPSDIVQTTSGSIQGISDDGVNIFRGVPYAAAPVGKLRWRAPQPVDAWEETLAATEFGPMCWQATDAGDAAFLTAMTEGAGMGGFTQWLLSTVLSLAPASVSEDCLTLNIVTPESADGTLPVLFWIHGGGHQFGSGGITYESPQLASRGAVVVTINYRLGLYGFMAHPELSAEDPNGSSGNYGMLDQIAALAWVQDNIASFGGDPDKVTIFGESAGGHSVGQLMASPLSKGLFHRAIAQSGTGFQQFQAIDAAYERMSGFDAGRQVAKMAGVSGADEIAALRQMSVDELRDIALDPTINATLHPQIDGYVLPQSSAQIFDAGRQAAVPLIVGSNADEGSVLYYMGLAPVDGGPAEQPNTVAEWDALLEGQFGPAASEVDLAYGVDTDSDVVKAAEQLMGDSWFGRHAFYMAQKHSAAGHPSYLYMYERRPPSENQTIGASHALEISHVFGGFIPFWPSDARDEELEDEMQSFWVHFAATGNPNREGLPEWRAFADLEPYEMAFGHDQTGARRVAREARYRAMAGQFEARLTSAGSTAAGGE